MLFIINLIPALYSNTHTARVRYGRPFFFLAMSLTTHHKIPSHTARPTQKRNNNGRWYEWPFIFSTPCDGHGRVHFMQHRVRHSTRPPLLPPGPLSSHQPSKPLKLCAPRNYSAVADPLVVPFLFGLNNFHHRRHHHPTQFCYPFLWTNRPRLFHSVEFGHRYIQSI